MGSAVRDLYIMRDDGILYSRKTNKPLLGEANYE